MSAAHVPSADHVPPPAMLPVGPPPEVEADILAALRRAEALAAEGRELHFDLRGEDDLRVQVRDLAGAVLRDLSPAEAWGVVGGLDGA